MENNIDLVSIVKALEELTRTVASQNSLASTILSTLIATLGSVAAVFIVEYIKTKCFEPRKQFETLRAKALNNMEFYASVATNVIDLKSASEQDIQRRIEASTELRMMAVEIKTLIDTNNKRKYNGIKSEAIYEAGRNLMYISNSLYTPYGMSECRFKQGVENHRVIDYIKELLTDKNARIKTINELFDE